MQYRNLCGSRNICATSHLRLAETFSKSSPVKDHRRHANTLCCFSFIVHGGTFLTTEIRLVRKFVMINAHLWKPLARPPFARFWRVTISEESEWTLARREHLAPRAASKDTEIVTSASCSWITEGNRTGGTVRAEHRYRDYGQCELRVEIQRLATASASWEQCDHDSWLTANQQHRSLKIT